jgi:hypothetical protein
MVTLKHLEIFGEFLSDRSEEEKNIKKIKSWADKISFLIISTDYPKIDIEIEKDRLREKINKLFPEKAHLYDLIYEPRFKRLEEQFRERE